MRAICCAILAFVFFRMAESYAAANRGEVDFITGFHLLFGYLLAVVAAVLCVVGL